MAAALTLYSWSLIALLIVMLAAKPHSASSETKGTANMLIRNTLMGRERTGRRIAAIAPHTRLIRRHGGRRVHVRPRKYAVRLTPDIPPGGRRTPRRDQNLTFQLVRLFGTVTLA